MKEIDITCIEEADDLPTAETMGPTIEGMLEIAREVFLRDQVMLPLFVIFCREGPRTRGPAKLVLPVVWNDKNEKYAVYDFVRELAAETKAVTVVHSAECWMSYNALKDREHVAQVMRDFKAGKLKSHFPPASQDPKRVEVVLFTVESSLLSPRNRSHMAPIYRDNASPTLGPWEPGPNMGDLFTLLPKAN